MIESELSGDRESLDVIYVGTPNNLRSMRSRAIEEYKKTLVLSSRQREILTGLLLGDGHLETQNDGRTYRLKVEQAVRKKEYVDWLFQEFREFVCTEPKEKEKTRNESQTRNVGFGTLSVGNFRFHAHQFYQGKRKVIPKRIDKLLSPLALAVWFMDDGSRKSSFHRAKILNTQGFRKEEIERLIRVLEKKFDLQSKLRNQKDGYQIYIAAVSDDLLKRTIGEHIVPCMRYKLSST